MPSISHDAYEDIQRIKSHHWRYSGREKAIAIEDEIYNLIDNLSTFSKKKQEFGWRIKKRDGMFINFYNSEDGDVVIYALYNEAEDWHSLMPGRMGNVASDY